MKSTGRHPDRALTSVRLKSLGPGRHADGNGLYLVVDPSGARRWILRTVVRGARRDIGLGGFNLVSLAEARELAAKFRRIARDGGDPIAERKKARAIVLTFETAARQVHADHSQAWRNAKHAAQWISSLDQYVIPIIGNLPVDAVDTHHILKVLAPIWLKKPETARRVRQRVGTVLDWAKAAGQRAGDNPVENAALGLPRQPDRNEHHAALPYTDVPEFVARLRESPVGETVRLAFEFLILTAARTSEVIGAERREVDFGAAVWVIPGARMKSKRPHRVPLAPRSLALLQRANELSAGGDYIFPSRFSARPISNMAFLMMMRRMQVDATPHGFRSSFRDWAAECTNFPRDVCEMALAHAVKDKVEAAYRRGDLFEKRRELMRQWAQFLKG
jgi:integrase